ncbi:MAG TPA: hypothetical protein VNE59_06700, partial [Burkholderiales bacterium]|nr:hypothetical protein [Burkholderiales bacterium]
TKQGLRALAKEKAIDPESVERYLFTKFGDGFDDALGAMQALAKSRSPAKLALEAYHLYEQFRPSVPEGTRGWGAKGTLELEAIRKLAR